MFLGIFFAQDDEAIEYKLIKPKHSYTIDFSVPISIANKPFKGVMQGFLRASASYQYSFKNKLNVGTGFNYTYFHINRFKISPQIVGGMHILNPFVKVGYENFFNERVGYDFGVKTGVSTVIFHSDSLQSNLKLQSNFIEPYIALALTADDHSSYKWMLAYNFLALKFTPDKIGDFVNEDYKVSEYARITRFISFGFCFTHYFKQRD